MPDVTRAYIGRGPCGCIRCAVIDRPGDEAAVRLAVARFCSGGYHMQRVTIEVARAGPFGCEECRERTPEVTNEQLVLGVPPCP